MSAGKSVSTSASPKSCDDVDEVLELVEVVELVEPMEADSLGASVICGRPGVGSPPGPMVMSGRSGRC